jgi:hypothetical protein
MRRSGSNDYFADGLHPGDEGQIKVADHLTPILAAALEKRVDRACESAPTDGRIIL